MTIISNIAIQYGKKALQISTEQNDKLATYLTYLAKAEIDALYFFKEYNKTGSLNTQEKKQILKPYPWKVLQVPEERLSEVTWCAPILSSNPE
jgi:hypothetical protein